MREADRDRENARYRSKSLVSKYDEDEGVVREAREKERNTRAEAVGGINGDMAELGKDLNRARYEAGMDGDALTSAETKAHMLLSKNVGAR